MLLIGSRAAHFWFSDFRQPKDWDVICSQDELFQWQRDYQHSLRALLPNSDLTKFKAKLINGSTIEFELIEKRISSQKMWEKHRSKADLFEIASFTPMFLPPPSALMAIKRSHLGYAIHWQKSILDYHFYKIRGVRISDEDLAIYDQRLRETHALHGDKSESFETYLDKSNKDFFQQSSKKVKRFYEHDDLHRATCFFEEPLYNRLKSNRDRALIERDLFENLSPNLKIKMVQEEGFAIALERQIIPKMEIGQPWDAQAAYGYAIQKIATALSRDWLSDYVIENYPEIIHMNYDFVTKFLTKAPERIRHEPTGST